MAMTGTFGGHAHLAIDLAAPDGEGVDLGADLANDCTVTSEPPAADVGALAGTADQIFADGSRGKVGKGEPTWYELRRLPAWVPGAFVSAEDGRFYDHHGFDLTQIGKSLEIDLRDHRIARGGSTISQQLIKNSFLTQRRSLDRKLQEAVLTWRLEQRLDKRTILERYLNIIELGPHVFGLRAAATHWFAVSPRELTIRQAAFLAALTSEPESMGRRVRHAGGLDPDSALRVEVILRAMHRDGVIGDEQLAAARESGMHFAQTALHAD
jgi:membrane peptidoglycan carboxypeptidase